MKVRNSLKSLRSRHRANRLVRRKGRVYVINKMQKRSRHARAEPRLSFSTAKISPVLTPSARHPMFSGCATSTPSPQRRQPSSSPAF